MRPGAEDVGRPSAESGLAFHIPERDPVDGALLGRGDLGNVVFKQTGSFNYQTVNETFPQGYRPKSANSVIVAAKNNLAFLVQPSGAVSIDGTIGELYCELSGCWITDDPLP